MAFYFNCQTRGRKRGFTLIELLVVIAVIGILVAVALIRYPFTVSQVRDARVMSALSQFRTEAALIYEIDKNYNLINCAVVSGECTCTDESLSLLCHDAQHNSDGDVVFLRNKNKQGFCLVSHLLADKDYFCIDGKLYAKRYPVSPAVPGGACKNSCQNANSCGCE